ncbi:phage protease [Nesterenkonia flava]|uniref:Phage protease n=1 Tax=Nesterenkonia flava TaxID=469799 RepID=A0ABU1FRX8_9MICC|nr:phage protease [Nesterenkonia flava]MDR5711411.1 phage protease [Nesterenkonia flava]
MDHVTIANVELLKTGTWQASTGEVTITRDDLQNIVTAFEARTLPLAVIKIGHTDPRFENPDWDGEPAYGQVDNLRIVDTETGSTLVGDYINVPAELAQKLPSAYPQRSVEIDWQVELRNEKDEVVESYPVVMTAVSLLGATPPAVKGLADVHAAFKQRKSQLSIHHTGKSTRLTARFAYPGGHTSESLRKALRDAVKGAVTNGFAWVEDFDDEHVWYEIETQTSDATGDVDFSFSSWQDTYTVQDTGAVVLNGQPVQVQVKRTYEPVPTPSFSQGAGVPHEPSQKPDGAAMGASQQTEPASSTPDEGEQQMFTDKHLRVLRAEFGLSEDATTEEVLEAIENHDDTPEAPEAPEDNDNETPETPEAPEDNDNGQGAELAAAAQFKAPEGTVLLSEARFNEMQTQLSGALTQLSDIRAEKDKERRDGIIRSALKTGRIVPSEAEKWRKGLDDNEQLTASLLSSLPKGHSFSTEELGSDLAAYAHDADEVIDQKTAEMDTHFFKGGK